MAKVYSGNSIKNSDNFEPKGDKINFLLNYSKALHILNCKELKFEIILN